LDYKQYTDEALVQRIRQQDAEALAELYDRYAQVIYNLIFRLIPDPAVAGEMLQQTFWQVWQERGNGARPGAVLTWLWRLARTKTMEQLGQDRNFSLKR
jgi:RNA polymerase sigma-70 factor (ECF subfamily)